MLATSFQIRRALRHESCELALQRFDYASAPALGDGQGRRIGKDVLFALLQTIEDAQRRGLGRGFRYLEPSVHIRIDGSEDDGMDRHALSGQERSSDCVMLNAVAFEIE